MLPAAAADTPGAHTQQQREQALTASAAGLPARAPAGRRAAAVYHVTEDGWKKVRGDDVTECHFEYYPDASKHASAGTPVI